MFKLNLKIALRNLWKHKAYTFINIVGLSIGLASCILIFIFIHYQLSFDMGFKNKDRIYRVVTNWKYSNYNDFSKGVPVPLIAAVRNEFEGLEKVAAIIKRGGIIRVKDDGGRDIIKTRETVYYTEPDYFDIFDMSWLFGKPHQALSQPNTVVLSETIARKFFGSPEKAIGKSILYGDNINLKVTGVFKDMPESSSFPLNIVISYQTFNSKKYVNWDSVSSETECYVLLKNGVSLSDLQITLAQFNKKYDEDKKINNNQTNTFQELKDIHFNERYGNFAGTTITKKEIYGLATIGLFLILTACINFINLSTAQSVMRSKEVGVRKVMGSERKQLILQFLTETFVVTILAMLIACVLTELALPGMQNLFKEHISFSLFGHPVIFVFMGVLVILVSFLAGFYPAMVMSGFSPALAIKNKVTANVGGLNLRKALVVLQFSITIILIIGTLVIMRQMEYLRQKPLGFNTDAVTMVNIPGGNQDQKKYNTFKERALQIPGVRMLSFCQNAPLSDDITTSSFNYNDRKNNDFEIRISKADENYFNLFDLKFIAGKAFLKSDTINGWVVNETFLKKMNISNPQDVLGKMLNAINGNGSNIPIVGVVKDFNDKSLREDISPLAIYAEKSEYYKAAIKIDRKHLIPAMKNLERLWNNTFPDNVYNASFLSDDISNYYQDEHVMSILFRVFTGVIIFISFIGLFGLISFVATQRTKEIAIRKVLGASTMELVKMLNGSFLLMVFFANLVACPLAYIFVSKWLSGFAYRMELNIWPFISAMLISMLITLITVSVRSYKSAIANMIDALKYE
ncbi:ABC transporter permease [Pedobacter foliorum]|uniref:ABC transporter permease n=1 Tax=Pedobacter foliorum TaxID=2739058 RepID=UPI00156577E2|nr:ABC transporter permease [Pedobacter foliorum]NRF40836.1 ABC transporter permease [Pedobacter foliorum]